MWGMWGDAHSPGGSGGLGGDAEVEPRDDEPEQRPREALASQQAPNHKGQRARVHDGPLHRLERRAGGDLVTLRSQGGQTAR